MFPSLRFVMTAPAHSLSISTGLRKVNAHAKIRLDLLTWPYVESCTGGGILPYVGVAAKLESQVKPIAAGSVLCNRFWRKPELHPEITHEVRLLAAGGFHATSSHQQQNERRMYLVARAYAERLLSTGWMEGSEAVKFGIQFEIFGQRVPHHDAGQPATRTCTNIVVAGFPIQIDGSEFFGKLQGQNQTGAARGNSPRHGAVRIVNRKLRKNGDGESRFFVVIKSPFHAQLVLPEPVFRSA